MSGISGCMAKHPEDHCALAASCKHDSAEVYGILSDNRTARLFLDICDLYEYNCDNKKALIISGWTLAHLFDEEDHCLLAQSCTHDGVTARGLAADGRTVRLFLDACDLHEYNCDERTDFKLVTVSTNQQQQSCSPSTGTNDKPNTSNEEKLDEIKDPVDTTDEKESGPRKDRSH